MKEIETAQISNKRTHAYVSIARICYLHFIKGMTQSAIADLLGIGRPRVSRLLQKGIEDGTVKFEITFPGYFPELESDLQRKYRGTKFVIAEPLDGSFEEARYSISRTAADYLSVVLAPGEKVAVGMGTTLRETADHFRANLPGTEFIAMVGGRRGIGLDVHANSVVEQLAAKTGGVAVQNFSPALVGSVEEAESLKRTAPISETLNLAAKSDTCLFSIEDPSAETSTLSLAGYHTQQDTENMREVNVVCDVMSLAFFDVYGRMVAKDVSDRAVSISYKDFAAIPRKICLAGGYAKHEAIGVALGADIIDVLITDAVTGEFLMDFRLPTS